MAKQKQWIHSKEDVLGQTLFVTIGDEQVAICLTDFNEEDRTRLAFQGLLIKIQRATAGKRSHADKVAAAIKKARELSEGRLVSDRTSAQVAATAKAVAAMRDAGVPLDVIKKAFPEWEG